jgi:hypothetical protein
MRYEKNDVDLSTDSTAVYCTPDEKKKREKKKKRCLRLQSDCHLTFHFFDLPKPWQVVPLLTKQNLEDGCLRHSGDLIFHNSYKGTHCSIFLLYFSFLESLWSVFYDYVDIFIFY